MAGRKTCTLPVQGGAGQAMVLYLFAELLPHFAKRPVQQFVFGKLLCQHRATARHIGVVEHQIDALTVGAHRIASRQLWRTEDHELVTALIQWSLTQEGQHEIRIERGPVESGIKHKETILDLTYILQGLELIGHDLGRVAKGLQELLTDVLVFWTIQADQGRHAGCLRQHGPLRQRDYPWRRCRSRLCHGGGSGAVRPRVIGEALLTGRARNTHWMVRGELVIGNL